MRNPRSSRLHRAALAVSGPAWGKDYKTDLAVCSAATLAESRLLRPAVYMVLLCAVEATERRRAAESWRAP